MFGTTAAKFYAKQTFKQLNKVYRPTWMPNEPVRIGDLGVLQNGVFRRLASFQEKFGDGEAVAIRPDPDPSPFDVTYSKSTKIVFKAAGETKADLPNIPQAKAGFGVEFSKAGAFTVRAAASYEPSVEDILDLQERVRRLYAAGRWNASWVVVVKLVSCPAATILISKSSSTKLEFSVSGDVPAGGVVLGSAELSFQLEASSNAALNLVDARNVTPFVQLMTLGQQVFEGVGLAAKAAKPDAGPPLPRMAGLTPAAVRTDKALRRTLVLLPATDPADDAEPPGEE